MEKLKSPEGYDTWLDYAVKTMEKPPFSPNEWFDRWGRAPRGDEMRAAARAELDELRAELAELKGKQSEILAGPTDEPQIELAGEWETGLFCGLEDQNLQSDAYGACRYGFEAGVERTLEWAQGIVHARENEESEVDARTEGMDETSVGIHGLAEALGLPQWWLVAEAAEGRLPHLHVGTQYIFNLQAVRRTLMERSRTEGMTTPASDVPNEPRKGGKR